MNPQIPNTQPFFGQKVSKQGVNVTQATDKDLIYKNDYSTTLYYDSSGLPRVLLGLRPINGTQGLFISQTGFDVTRATDTQLAFNSSQSVLQEVLPKATIIMPGSTIAYNSFSIKFKTIAHGLPYTPAVLAYANILWLTELFVDPIPANVQLPYSNSFLNVYSGSGDSFLTIEEIAFSVDETNIHFRYTFVGHGTSGSSTVPDIPITYYVLSPSAV